MLEELREAMAERGLTLTWDDSVLDYLVKKSYSVTYGARNLRRTIQKDVEDKIASAIIDGYDSHLTAVSVTAPDGAVRVDVL